MSQSKSSIPPLAIIGALFFIFGFVTWLNGSLIPFLKIACELEYSEALLVTFAFYIAYVLLAIPSSYVLQATGFKNGMALGLVVMAVGALVFIPAAYSRSFSFFLIGLFIQGAGLALLQTASNPYVSILGPIESAAQRISIMGICSKIAGALSPVILGAFVLKGASALETKLAQNLSGAERTQILDQLSERVITPYIVMAIVLVILATLVKLSGLPEINMDEEEKTTTIPVHSNRSVFEFRNLTLGILAIFMYVGVEVIAGDTIGSYGSAQGISLDISKFFTSLTMIAMLVGYSIGIFTIPRFISQQNALKICAIIGILFSIGVLLTHGFTSVLFVALLGLANSLMWPAIFPLGIRGLGAFTKLGSALLIMGIGGGAVLPLLYGKLSEVVGIQNGYLILLPCYLYILFYATNGYKTKTAPVAMSR